MRPNCSTLVVCIRKGECRFKEGKQMLGSAMCRLLPEEEGRECNNTAPGPGTSPASIPARGAGQAWRKQPVSAARLHLQANSQWWGRSKGKAGKSIHRSGTGSGLVRITRVRARPVIAGQLCTDKTGLKTSREMVQTNRVHARHGCDGGEREREQHSHSIAGAGTGGTGLSWNRVLCPGREGRGHLGGPVRVRKGCWCS